MPPVAAGLRTALDRLSCGPQAGIVHIFRAPPTCACFDRFWKTFHGPLDFRTAVASSVVRFCSSSHRSPDGSSPSFIQPLRGRLAPTLTTMPFKAQQHKVVWSLHLQAGSWMQNSHLRYSCASSWRTFDSWRMYTIFFPSCCPPTFTARATATTPPTAM